MTAVQSKGRRTAADEKTEDERMGRVPNTTPRGAKTNKKQLNNVEQPPGKRRQTNQGLPRNRNAGSMESKGGSTNQRRPKRASKENRATRQRVRFVPPTSDEIVSTRAQLLGGQVRDELMITCVDVSTGLSWCC